MKRAADFRPEVGGHLNLNPAYTFRTTPTRTPTIETF
jgi:hypothetical protein